MGPSNFTVVNAAAQTRLENKQTSELGLRITLPKLLILCLVKSNKFLTHRDSTHNHDKIKL
jgi:hypothetical protein